MFNDKRFDGLRPDTDVAHLFHRLVYGLQCRYHRLQLRGFPHAGIALNPDKLIRGSQHQGGRLFLAIGESVQHGFRYLFQQRLLCAFPFLHHTQNGFLHLPGGPGNQYRLSPCGYGQQLAIFNHRANFIPDSFKVGMIFLRFRRQLQFAEYHSALVIDGTPDGQPGVRPDAVMQ